MPHSLQSCLFTWSRAGWLMEGRHVMLFNCKFVAEPIEQEVKVSYDWTTEINSYKCNGNRKMKIKQTILFSDINCLIMPIFNAGTQFWVSRKNNNWYKIPESSVTISHCCLDFSNKNLWKSTLMLKTCPSEDVISRTKMKLRLSKLNQVMAWM